MELTQNQFCHSFPFHGYHVHALTILFMQSTAHITDYINLPIPWCSIYPRYLIFLLRAFKCYTSPISVSTKYCLLLSSKDKFKILTTRFYISVSTATNKRPK